MSECEGCPASKDCKTDVNAQSRDCIYTLTRQLSDALSLIEKYKSKGEPDKLVMPIHCGQCGLYRIESYSCLLNSDEWTPDNYCSHGRPAKLGA